MRPALQPHARAMWHVLGSKVPCYEAWSKASNKDCLLQVADSLGPAGPVLLVAGGVAYSVGGLIYAVRWPDPNPKVFGYHEIFHMLVIVAAALHFATIYLLVQSKH